MTRTVRLCASPELAEGRSRGFDPHGEGRDTVFVVRHSGRLHGWRNDCPHIDGAPMAWRKDAYLNSQGTHIVCSAHGAQFDIETGLCTLGPCVGESLTPVAVQETQDEIHIVTEDIKETTS